MKRAPIWLQPFDRDRDFVVARRFTCKGRKLKPGEPFDPKLVTTRRLRQLYEARWVRMTDKNEEPQVADQTPPVDWQALCWLEMRKHVHAVTGTFPKSKAHADELMEAHDGVAA